MMEEGGQHGKSTRGMKWQWEKLTKVRTKEEFQAVLAETAAMIGDDDVTITLPVSAKGFLKIMGDAYVAWNYGELEKPGTKELLDRALAVYSSIYLKLLMKSGRERH